MYDFVGVGIGIIGLGTAIIFACNEKKRRHEKEKKYLEKRQRCGKLLINAHSDKNTPNGYRTIKWLRLDTGMSDSEFYDFYNEFRKFCLRDEREKDSEIIVKVKEKDLDDFEEMLSKKPNQN